MSRPVTLRTAPADRPRARPGRPKAGDPDSLPARILAVLGEHAAPVRTPDLVAVLGLPAGRPGRRHVWARLQKLARAGLIRRAGGPAGGPKHPQSWVLAGPGAPPAPVPARKRVRCLGPFEEHTFESPDPVRVRVCDHCRRRLEQRLLSPRAEYPVAAHPGA